MVSEMKRPSMFARGFTLIELLIVMSIVGLLLTIAVPRYFGSVDKSKEVALRENLKVMRTGIDRYYADKGVFPATLTDLVTNRYFRTVPMDPITESSSTWQLVPSPDPDKPGVADVKSGAKGKTREGVPYEQL
jgi:general secretion pathway protein G